MDAAEVVSLESRRVLVRRGGDLSHVYFPLGAVISLVVAAEGRCVEAATVGREGFFGVGVALGTSMSEMEAIVQTSGEALRLPGTDFRALLRDDRAFRRQVDRYTYLMLSHVARNVACNRFHLVEQRLARWLLMSSDRTRSRRFRMTHDVLAQMLGVRRPGVTSAASALQARNLIRYNRGTIDILDRAALEEASCECYRAQFQAYKQLFG